MWCDWFLLSCVLVMTCLWFHFFYHHQMCWHEKISPGSWKWVHLAHFHNASRSKFWMYFPFLNMNPDLSGPREEASWDELCGSQWVFFADQKLNILKWSLKCGTISALFVGVNIVFTISCIRYKVHRFIYSQRHEWDFSPLSSGLNYVTNNPQRNIL